MLKFTTKYPLGQQLLLFYLFWFFFFFFFSFERRIWFEIPIRSWNTANDTFYHPFLIMNEACKLQIVSTCSKFWTSLIGKKKSDLGSVHKYFGGRLEKFALRTSFFFILPFQIVEVRAKRAAKFEMMVENALKTR